MVATIGKGHGSPCVPATQESWQEARQHPLLAQLCQQIENCTDAEEQKKFKDRLPVWTPRFFDAEAVEVENVENVESVENVLPENNQTSQNIPNNPNIQTSQNIPNNPNIQTSQCSLRSSR